MKRILTFVYLLIFNITSSWAQGLLPDSAAYSLTKMVPTYSGEKYAKIPDSVSLRKYCPTPRNQFQTSTCVGFAVGYGALSICRAIQGGITDSSKLDEIAYSAIFLYNSITSRHWQNCQEGAWFDNAFDFLKQNGDCTARLMSNDTTNCSHDIPKFAMEEAKKHKIKDYAKVFDIDISAPERTRRVCQMIAAKNPVIIGYRMYDSSDNKIWSRGTKSGSYHALVVVGYNKKDRTFDVMNSWGTNWGKGGFITLSFEIFEKYVYYAYVITPNDNINISGELKCQKKIGAKFDSMAIELKKERGVYQLEQSLEIGSIFQLTSLHVPKGKYLYVFSVDAGGKTMIHYPFTPNDYCPIMSDTAEILIPAKELGIEISKMGENAFIVLYSDFVIGDFDKRVKDVSRHTKGDIQTKLNKAFEDILISSSKIQYDDKTMKLNSLSEHGQGFVAPLILMINGKEKGK